MGGTFGCYVHRRAACLRPGAPRVKDGKRYAHILDPRTGWPASGCQSVTLVAATAMTADALATGVFVLGPEAGMALVERTPAVEAMIVDAGGQVHISSGLRR